MVGKMFPKMYLTTALCHTPFIILERTIMDIGLIIKRLTLMLAI